MKFLKNCLKFSCSVKIYVPSTVNVNESKDTQEWVEKALELLSKEFGGATASKALGAWISASGDLIKENVTLVFAYVNQSELEGGKGEKIYDFCLLMKKELGQEAIALEINNELYLV